MNRRRQTYWLALATLSSAAAAPLHAQAAPPPPAAAAPPPAAAVPPTREELRRVEQAPQESAAPTLQVSAAPQAAPCALADEQFKDLTITLSDAEFAGLRGVDAAILRPTYEAYLGRPQPIAIVCEIRAAADAILARAGYISAVRVPPQKIDDGKVRFEVVMAHLVALRVRGDAGTAEDRIAAYLQPLKDAPVFNARDAERSLLLAGDIPGYEVRLALLPAEGGAPGDVIGEIAVSRQFYNVDFNLQDYGSRSVGRIGGLMRAQLYGTLVPGDRTTLGFFSTSDFKEQQVIQLGHDLPVGASGLALSGRFTYAWTRPAVVDVDIEARTLIGEVELSYPFVRSQAFNLRGGAGFDLVDQTVDVASALFTRDHLRVAYLRLDADQTDAASIAGAGGYSLFTPRLRVATSFELRHGIDVFDATEPCGPTLARCSATGAIVPSRAYADPTAFLARFTGIAEFRPLPRLTLALSERAQYAPHALLSYEEFSGGSYTIGRGFDPGTVLGDSGAGISLEVRAGSTTPRSLTSFAFEPYAFVDAAWAWNRDPDLKAFNAQRLISVGGGVRAAYGDRFRLDAAIAVPVDRSGPAGFRNGSVRFLISLTTRLLPLGRP